MADVYRPHACTENGRASERSERATRSERAGSLPAVARRAKAGSDERERV